MPYTTSSQLHEEQVHTLARPFMSTFFLIALCKDYLEKIRFHDRYLAGQQIVTFNIVFSCLWFASIQRHSYGILCTIQRVNNFLTVHSDFNLNHVLNCNKADTDNTPKKTCNLQIVAYLTWEHPREGLK
jgi:hypothetical protein